MGERLKKLRKEVFTFPNAITFGRLLLSPKYAKHLYEDPAKNCKKVGKFMATDNLDGLGAKVGSRSRILSLLGFRKSEVGRIADPVTDTIVTSEMVVAGMLSGVVPVWLGGMALTQKAFKSYHGISYALQGAEVHVTDFGRHMEGLTNISAGLLFPGENIENEEQRRNYRQKCLAGAVIGIAGAYMADRGYVAQAREQLGLD